MITVTEKSRSAALALTELAARTGGPVPIQEIADARAIPLHFLEQLFSGLRRAGVLQSQRGVKGGYSFRRTPHEVTLLEIVEAVDGHLDQTPPDPSAGADQVWADARIGLAELLRGVTVADLLEREARLRAAPMFHI